MAGEKAKKRSKEDKKDLNLSENFMLVLKSGSKSKNLTNLDCIVSTLVLPTFVIFLKVLWCMPLSFFCCVFSHLKTAASGGME